MSNNNLRSLDKKVAKSKKIYKPILDNPYVNEINLFPHVENQQLVWQLLQDNVLNKCKMLKADVAGWPFEIYTGFNNVVEQLSNNKNDENPSNKKMYLFVCNRDSGVSSILLQQLPLLCYKANTRIIQLPKGAFPVISSSLATLSETAKCLAPYSDGILLLLDSPKLNKSFTGQLDANVAPLNFPWLDVVYKPANLMSSS